MSFNSDLWPWSPVRVLYGHCIYIAANATSVCARTCLAHFTAALFPYRTVSLPIEIASGQLQARGGVRNIPARGVKGELANPKGARQNHQPVHFALPRTSIIISFVSFL